MAKKVTYGEHAREKFRMLRSHGFVVSEEQIRETVQYPEKLEDGYKGREVTKANDRATRAASHLRRGGGGDQSRHVLSGKKESV
jgi:hypothetical protein